MKKTVQRIVLLLLSLVVLASGGPALADSGDDPGRVHFVLVIDCTGSMNEADSEGMSVAAAELFVDMVPMDNATVSVICFGRQWRNIYDFKNGALEQMKPFLDSDGEYHELFRSDNRYVESLCELRSLTSVTERSVVKSAIEDAEAVAGGDSMTVANTAMLAAIDLLKSAGAEPNNACIVLMSDGRVQVARREAMDAVTAINPYPSYVLELNYDQKNAENSIAREQLSDVAAQYDGDRDSNRYIEVKSAGDIIQAVSSVIGRFVDLQSVNPTRIEMEGSEAEKYTFFVPEMASETNLVVTGQGFHAMEVTSPDGSTARYENTNTVDPDNTFIRNGDKYAVLKIKRPTIGEWGVKIYGDPGTQIYIHAVSAKELSLVLRASGYEPESRDTWLKNDVIPFTAAFEYEGGIVRSDAFYADNPAQLWIKNDNTNRQIGPILSTATENGYAWNVPLQEAGALEVSVTLPYEGFRDGQKESNVLSYTVTNLALKLGDTSALSLPASMRVHETTNPPLDVSQVFINPDCDEVSYSIACKDQDGLSGDMDVDVAEQGVIELTMPSKAGDYTATLSAKDVNMQQPVSVDFQVSVVNTPIQELKRLTLDPIVIHQPEWLTGKTGALNYDLDEYYTDPDGLPLTYSLRIGKDNPEIQVQLLGSRLVADATETGGERAVLTVTDSSGDTREISLNFRCETWLSVLLQRNMKWFIIGGAALAIAIFLASIRRVKGGWYVSIDAPGYDQCTERLRTLQSQHGLRKTKFSVRKLLTCVETMNEEDQNVPDLSSVRANPVMHGTLIFNSVKITGLDYAHSRAEAKLRNKRDDYKAVRKLRRNQKSARLYPGDRLELVYRSETQEDGELTVLLEME
ncbi:MAG: hypothetical protein VB034_01075 [Eubacteriales bacterium]|nr:hypothetical protein [Eubacteriales bacterium]